LSTASPSPKEPLHRAVGDKVVYGAHGVGEVVALEQRQVKGSKHDCVVVELAAGLRITLTLQEATARLRPVADKRQLEDVRGVLASRPSWRDERWTIRIKESKAKLAAGEATDLAEIVRDGDRYERTAKEARLSHQEQRIYSQARTLLVREVCVARGVTEEAAQAWIEAQMASLDGSED
jgi:CarD family transcriptional regulator, regulator of rRNA transcription